MPDTRMSLNSETAPNGLVDLGKLVNIAAKNMMLIASFVLGAAIIGFLIVGFATPQFRASAQLMLDPRENLVTGEGAVLSNVEITEQIVATEVAVLRSNVLIGQVVDRLNLDELPEFSLPENVLTMRSRLTRRVKALFGISPEKLAPSKAQIVAAVQKNFTVEQEGISNAVSVEFQSQDPNVAAAAANALVEAYIDRRYDESIAATKSATVWLSDRTEELRAEISELERIESQRRTKALSESQGGRDSVTAELALMSEELGRVRARTVEKETFLNRLTELEVSVGLLAVSRLIETYSFEQLRAKRSDKALELAQANRTSSSTTVTQRAQSELDEINHEIEVEAGKYLDALSREVEILNARSQALEAYSEELMVRLLEIEQRSIEIRQAAQETAAARSVYQALLIRLNETRSQEAFGNASAQQIVRAEAPSGHATPQRALTVASTSFLGAALALLVIALREVGFDRFHSLRDLERFAGKPVLAGLPSIRSVRLFRGRENWSVSSDATFAEQLRRVRSRLQFDSNFNSASALMITSSLKGEGKTEVLVALAKLFVRSGRTVLTIDCDFLNPRLSMQTVGLKHRGICDILAKGVPVIDAIVRDDEAGFDVLTVGSRETINPDLLATTMVGPLFERLTAQYDMVLIDTPPVQVSSDAQTVGVHVDQTIVIYDYSSTSRDVLGATLHELQRSCVDLNGILANRVPKQDQYSIEYY